LTVIRGVRRLAHAALLMAAANPAAADDSIALLPTLQVTAGRSEQSLAAAPQAISVVDGAALDAATPQVVGDLLRGQPGVFLQSSAPGQGIAIVRGLKGSEVLHLVDGMRLNMAFMRNSPSQYLALVDPYNVSRVELLRGAGGTLYGSDALGGVLQILTPEPHFDGDDWQLDGRVRVRYGSADVARIARTELAAGHDALSLSGGLTHMQFGARDIGEGGRQPFTAYDMRAADAKLLWSPRDGHELMLSTQFSTAPKLPRTFEIVGGPGGDGSDLPVFFEPNERRFVHARYRITTPLAFADVLEAHLAQQLIDDDRVRLVNDATRENESNRSTLHGLTVQAITTRGARRWTYGVDLYDDRIDSAKSRTDLDSNAVSTRDPTFPDGARTRDLGVYLNTDWQPASRWLLQAGLRYSHVDTALTATRVSPAADIVNDDVTAHLGSAYTLTPSLRWTANLSRGFRAPNIFDLGTLGPRPNTAPQVINVPNTALDKETLVSVDTGLKWISDGLRVDVSLFHAWHHDRIEPREPTGNTIAEGQFGCSEAQGCIEVRSENLAEARFWGIESGLRTALGPQAELYATLNITRGEERRDGASGPANRIPPLNGQLGLAYAPTTDLQIEPWLRFAAAQDRLDDDDRSDVRIDPDGTPGWVTANLRLAWTPTPTWRLQLDGLNLLDQAYREHGSGVDGAGAGIVLGIDWRY
jgi:outer membrane receptor protein involved in Fe transport